MTPGISPSRRSSGAATLAAMVAGSAPGRLAVTWMVGKLDVGQRRHRQELIGHRADQEHADTKQDRRDRPLDEGQ